MSRQRNVRQLLRSLRKVRGSLRRIRARKKRLLKRLQNACLHFSVFETLGVERQTPTEAPSDRPGRFCLVCGYEEHPGKRRGYRRLLHKNLYQLPHDRYLRDLARLQKELGMHL